MVLGRVLLEHSPTVLISNDWYCHRRYEYVLDLVLIFLVSYLSSCGVLDALASEISI